MIKIVQSVVRNHTSLLTSVPVKRMKLIIDSGPRRPSGVAAEEAFAAGYKHRPYKRSDPLVEINMCLCITFYCFIGLRIVCQAIWYIKRKNVVNYFFPVQGRFFRFFYKPG